MSPAAATPLASRPSSLTFYSLDLSSDPPPLSERTVLRDLGRLNVRATEQAHYATSTVRHESHLDGS